MWIALNVAFLSIVAHRDEPGMLLVRARISTTCGRRGLLRYDPG